MNKNRLALVKALIELSLPLDELDSRLREFDWDFEDAPIELRRTHVIYALGRYLNGELSASDVERWANLVEGREDIYFEESSGGQLDEVIYELANPTLTASLDEVHASTIIEALSE